MNQVIQRTPNAEPREIAVLVPRTDVWESANAYHFDVELPGVDPQAISIEFERGVLTIEAEVKAPAPQSSEGPETAGAFELAHREFTYGTYRRAFRLPDGVDGDAIEAQSKHGVLSLSVPKKANGARKIAVRAS
ncbi:MAG: Hsp20/alpha crystallin family protein [Planctomycetes bacterium]|nr:Hsp20/alpha crystallin family protein [Planctomycetota bacterium]